ncbi:MAG: cache domain-containing protein [Firmicutes bacterium]|nr:cache domain-containing protein [Bacillota bacterium]
MTRDGRRPARRRRSLSIQQYLVRSFVVLLVVLSVLFAGFAYVVLERRIRTNIDNLLDRSLVIAWEEYDRFFAEGEASLSVAARSAETKEVFAGGRGAGLASLLGPKFEVWVAFDASGRPILASGEPRSIPRVIAEAAAPSYRSGLVSTSSEVVPVTELVAFEPSLEGRATIELRDEADGSGATFPLALVQVVGVPVSDESGARVGSLVAARLVNNDTSVPSEYSRRIPGSYLSVGLSGVRVSANIKSSKHSDFVGIRQSEELVAATSQGRRYTGRAQIEPGDIHFVVSEPIRDHTGRPVAALSVGVPSGGFANLQRDTTVALIVWLTAALLVTMGASAAVAGRCAAPVASLCRLAQEITRTEAISPELLEELGRAQKPKVQELEHLQSCFRRMASTLYDSLRELDRERSELQNLARQLQEANLLLERKVEERTIELRDAVMELKAANRLKTQFLANMSHELRTPLNSIIGFSEMLHDGLYGELNRKQKEYVEIILRSSRHLLQVLSDILDLSRVEQGMIVLARQEVRVDELVEAVTAIVRHQAERQGLELRTDVEPDLPALWVDPLRIKQVLYNLLSNAVKFTPPGGKVVLEARRAGDEVTISVTDTGIGISEEDQKRVFDEFYQCENLYERKFEGVGLGLPLSKRLVALHGGRIELWSRPGEGTRVKFSLPIGEVPRVG